MYFKISFFKLERYHLKVGVYYNMQHLEENEDYHMEYRLEEPTLLRVKIHSRFSAAKMHHVFIQYVPSLNDIAGIAGRYCTCKNGARTTGCCSHLAAVSFTSNHINHSNLL